MFLVGDAYNLWDVPPIWQELKPAVVLWRTDPNIIDQVAVVCEPIGGAGWQKVIVCLIALVLEQLCLLEFWCIIDPSLEVLLLTHHFSSSLTFSLPPFLLPFLYFSPSLVHPYFLFSFVSLLFLLLCASLLASVPHSGATVLRHFLPP